MAEFDSAQLRQWAVRGAEQRLQEIAAEAAAIYRAFPELRDRGQRRSGDGHGGDCGEGPAARPRQHVCGTAQGGQRADAEVLGSASRGRRRRDIRRQRDRRAKAKAARPARTAAAKRTRGPRKMSAAARKRISDAQKKRWAARRANG